MQIDVGLRLESAFGTVPPQAQGGVVDGERSHAVDVFDGVVDGGVECIERPDLVVGEVVGLNNFHHIFYGLCGNAILVPVAQEMLFALGDAVEAVGVVAAGHTVGYRPFCVEAVFPLCTVECVVAGDEDVEKVARARVGCAAVPAVELGRIPFQRGIDKTELGHVRIVFRRLALSQQHRMIG